jgi:hypothetical protein
MTLHQLVIVLTIIAIHWIADFVCQAEEWATNKSKNNAALVRHTAMYSLIWFWGCHLLFSNLLDVLAFVGITFVAHTITDYITSRIVSRKFANKEFGSPIPNTGAFTVIGFDQVLHYIQLFGTYYLLTNR